MVNSLYLLTILAQKHALYLWQDSKYASYYNSDYIWYQSFYITSLNNTLKRLNLVTGTILIIYSVHFILIQVNLPQVELPKMLITQVPKRRVTQ